MAKSHFRGNQIEFINNEFVYSDTKQPTAETHKDRPCGNGGKMETKEGHDACLGTLPGVMNACCGHGILSEAFVQFMDGTGINGVDAIIMINKMKKDD